MSVVFWRSVSEVRERKQFLREIFLICQIGLTLLALLLNQYGKLEDLTERYTC